MHELSLAQNIVDIVHQYVPAKQSNTVKSVKLRIGELSGVVAESLEFCFSAIVAGTPLRGTTLDIERTPFALRCKTCGHSFTNEYGEVTCPNCFSNATEVVSGTEMRVVEIELKEDGRR